MASTITQIQPGITTAVQAANQINEALRETGGGLTLDGTLTTGGGISVTGTGTFSDDIITKDNANRELILRSPKSGQHAKIFIGAATIEGLDIGTRDYQEAISINGTNGTVTMSNGISVNGEISQTGGVNNLTLRKGTGTPAIRLGGTSDQFTGQIEGITGGGIRFYHATGTFSSPIATQRLDVTSNGISVTGTGRFSNSDALLILQDTNTSGSGISSLLSFRDSGDVERGWVGYGDANGLLRVRNNVGDIILTRGTTDTLRLDGNGISITGNITATGTITPGSDIKLKENIKLIDNLERFDDVQFKEFDFKADGRHSFGVIAQELEKIEPTLVVESGTGADAIKHVDYFGLLCAKVARLEKRIEELENK